MAALVTLIAGPARSGKTERLLDEYRRVLADRPPGSALWLCPTSRAVGTIREQILQPPLAGVLLPNCLTFEQFARRIVESCQQELRPVNLAGQRQLIKLVVEQACAAQKLDYFAPIAETPGFVDLLVATIQDLKRLEVWPAELAAAAGGFGSPKDRELCWLYGQYQDLLTARKLYDPQGQFWSAREMLRGGWRRPFDAVRQVFVDGFTDFTRTEHEILELVSAQAETLSITLPLEIESNRPHLFLKPARTLNELRERHASLNVVEVPCLPSAWPAISHLERQLFVNPREALSPPPADGIEILAAAGATSEIELVARRVKKLLIAPAAGGTLISPGDILVVFRSLAGLGPLVRETFAEFGIPTALDEQPRLHDAPNLRALCSWLRFHGDDWPYRGLLSLVHQNYFRPRWRRWRGPTTAVAVERVVRWLQISSGREQLLAGAERLAKRAAAEAADGHSDARASIDAAARIAWPLLRRLSRTFVALPRRATLAAWTEAISSLAATLGLAPRLPGKPRARQPNDTDSLAWQQFLAALAASDRLCQWSGRADVELSFGEFLAHLESLLACEPWRQARDESGRVRVVSAEQARTLSAPYVFLAGLTERAFPPPRPDDCLFNEADAQRLLAAGLPVARIAEHGAQEMLLFYEVVTRATRRLVLSYPAVDANAQPLCASPYLEEIERLFGPGVIARFEQRELHGLPEVGAVLSPRDLRMRAVGDALAGSGEGLAQLAAQPATSASAVNVRQALRTSVERGRNVFGPHEGLFTTPVARTLLNSRFGPERIWSPSQLEQYAFCPFQFLMHRVLKLEPLDELGLEVDYAGRGQLLHQLLSEMHRALNARGQGPTSPGVDDEAAFIRGVLDRVARTIAALPGGASAETGLREIDARRIVRWLADYYQQHLKYDAAWQEQAVPFRPAYFEVAFGPRGGSAAASQLDPDDPLSSAEPFEFLCEGETIRFAGRIDRIDLGQVGGQVVFNVVDYKSSKTSRPGGKQVLDGSAMQLPLYALAAERLLAGQGAVPFEGAYWHVASKGYTKAIQFHADAGGRLSVAPEWQTIEADLRTHVLNIVNGIRQGEFPMSSADDKCTARCAYHTLCRVRQVRAIDKPWPPGAPV